MASVGSIVGGSFRLLVERPGSVVAWAATYFLGTIAVALLSFGLIAGSAFGADAIDPGGSAIAGMFGAIALFYLLFLLLGVVLMNAVYRTVLRPEDSSLAGLRLGMDELRMFGLVILIALVSMVLGFIGNLLVSVITAALSLALGRGGLAVAVSTLVLLAYAGVWIWVMVRLSLLYPLTFLRRRISLDSAWELAGGRFWTLFLSYLVIWGLLAVVAVALFFATFGNIFAALAAAGEDPEMQQMAASGLMIGIIQASTGWKIAMGAIWAALAGVFLALGHGAFAVATRELLEERGAFAAGEGDPPY